MSEDLRLEFNAYMVLKVKEFERLISSNANGLMYFINYHIKSPNYHTYRKFLNGDADPNHYDWDPDQVITIPFDLKKWCSENLITFEEYIKRKTMENTKGGTTLVAQKTRY